ncbi:hypothetical protein K435DRAFT_771764 [Dendrothele bispora CBS 962.96]|uniref:Uncharacterized protein n=1 Tax=Dendrothele bispora (strain CBS 962.96) TaxID=1314807 RepID=A0A4S8MXR2_DENBC|nr:hypothetical protein K435DRAFT_771764 [Dendrothele bispora CBS 962.96]
MDSQSKSKMDTPPPAYSVSDRTASGSGSTLQSLAPAPTPPVLDPYNSHNPYNNPWVTASNSSVASSASPGLYIGGSRQPLLQQPGFYAYSDMPQFPNYPRFDGSANSSLHFGHGHGFGPTPSQTLFQHGHQPNQQGGQGQVTIPYAYYDPHSPYSLAQADIRARKRFLVTMTWILGFWVLVGLVVRGSMEGWFDGVVKVLKDWWNGLDWEHWDRPKL